MQVSRDSLLCLETFVQKSVHTLLVSACLLEVVLVAAQNRKKDARTNSPEFYERQAPVVSSIFV